MMLKIGEFVRCQSFGLQKKNIQTGLIVHDHQVQWLTGALRNSANQEKIELLTTRVAS